MHSSCIFFYIIEFIRTGKDEKILEFEKKQYEPNKFKIFFIIITIGFGLNNYISCKMSVQNYTILETRIYHVIFNAIFCRFILGYKIYKHQLLSIILININLSRMGFNIYTNIY